MIGRKENLPTKENVKRELRKQLSKTMKNRIRFTVHLKIQRFFKAMDKPSLIEQSVSKWMKKVSEPTTSNLTQEPLETVTFQWS